MALDSSGAPCVTHACCLSCLYAPVSEVYVNPLGTGMSRLLVLMTNKCSTAYVCIQKIPSATFLKGISHRLWDITRICHHFLTAGTPTILRMKGAAVLDTFFTAC